MCSPPSAWLFVRGRAFLGAVADPSLFDQIGAHVVGILFAQQVAEALHPGRSQNTAQQNILELGMQSGIELSKVRCGAGAELVAARTLLDEGDFTGVDLRLRRL